ncbi:AgmX/PglI C-terminal domain-containing protein [Endozoicomonas sp. G2_1]|uniref:AgmX/PglI C-terminal domain-containing protein n=1 Tax=Endozoicomonas sp. G2_1 TaxID=2821091 RepID=UPI001ADD139F|nr:AgmX/PglI C-terminal domain-containing protein [Endozoicomonas sp. G2_1]MBO9488837.1 AgmX/PglI C-terminal domain-containing protein [Endozoicomonas sp. G2_1]
MSAANLIVDNHGRKCYQQGADSSYDRYSDNFNDKLNDSAKQALSGLAANLSQYSKQDKMFVRILIALVIVYLAIAVIVPFIERVEQTRELKEQVPPELTRVVLERKQKPKPPPEPKIEEVKPEPKQEPKKPPEVKKPKPEPVVKPKQPLTKRQAAKQKAQSSGLAAMKDELLAMREVLVTAPVASQQLAKGERDQNRAQRKLLAAKADQQSVQLAKAKVSQTVSSDALSSHSSQRIRLSEQEVLASGNGEAKYADVKTLDNLRSELSIRQTLEASKARLYALYNRALRKDPLLQGKVVFNIEIQPSGEISQLDIAVSELNNAKLERQLLVILRSINFGQEDVDVMATAWSIEFLPR